MEFAKPELTKELLRQVAAIMDIEIRETVISLPGAKGFWLTEELDIVVELIRRSYNYITGGNHE